MGGASGDAALSAAPPLGVVESINTTIKAVPSSRARDARRDDVGTEAEVGDRAADPIRA